jgi:hypothetical protein
MKRGNRQIPILIMILFAGIALVFLKVSITGYVVISNPTYCDGADLDKNGKVNDVDLLLFNSSYGRTDCSSPSWCGGADIDQNRRVDFTDFSFFSQRYGNNTCLGVCSVSDDCYGTSVCISGKCRKEADWCDGTDLEGGTRNGKVDSSDRYLYNQVYAFNYGRTDCNSGNSWCDLGDLNKDGKITLMDKTIFDSNYGRTDCGIVEKRYYCSVPYGPQGEGIELGPLAYTSPGDDVVSWTYETNPNIPLEPCMWRCISGYEKDSSRNACIATGQQTQPSTYCGNANGNSFTSQPGSNLCNSTLNAQIEGTVQSTSAGWTWTCKNAATGTTSVCNAVKINLCTQRGYTCGNTNESQDRSQSCAVIKMEWDENSTLDSSCSTQNNIGCCKPCSYGFNETSKKCYTERKKCSVLKGDICNEETETCSGTYFNSLDENCCDRECVSKNIVDFRPTATNLRRGYTTELRKNTDTIRFEVDNKDHKLEVLEVTETTVKIKISSDTVTETLKEGDTRRYDLDNNGYYDTKIVLDEIVDEDDGIVEITMYSINEKITTTTQTQQKDDNYQASNAQTIELGEEESNSWYYLIFLIVILVVFVGVLLYLAYKKNR